MMVNWQAFAFVSAVAIGAIAEFITQQERNPYRIGVAASKIFIVALLIAMIPPVGGKWTLLGLFVARTADILGKIIYTVVVRSTVKWDMQQWDENQIRLEEKRET